MLVARRVVIISRVKHFTYVTLVHEDALKNPMNVPPNPMGSFGDPRKADFNL